jgi:hypothetical protein
VATDQNDSAATEGRVVTAVTSDPEATDRVSPQNTGQRQSVSHTTVTNRNHLAQVIQFHGSTAASTKNTHSVSASMNVNAATTQDNAATTQDNAATTQDSAATTVAMNVNAATTESVQAGGQGYLGGSDSAATNQDNAATKQANNAVTSGSKGKVAHKDGGENQDSAAKKSVQPRQPIPSASVQAGGQGHLGGSDSSETVGVSDLVAVILHALNVG